MLVDVPQGSGESGIGIQAPTDSLSGREREVLQRIARGYSNREAAGELGLSVKTVETYKARIADKLNLRSRVDIVRFAAEQGWLSGGSEEKTPTR